MGCICAFSRRANAEDLRQLEKTTSKGSASYASTPSSPYSAIAVDVHRARHRGAEIVYDSSPNSVNADGTFDFGSSDPPHHRFHDEHKVNLYAMHEKKGSGAFASVFLCQFQGVQMAVKKVLVTTQDDHRWSGKTTLKDAENELEILRTLQRGGGHSNVVRFIDDFYETTPYDEVFLHLVMEFMPSTLHREIGKHQSDGNAIPGPLIQLYSLQILRALQFLECRGIIHRDVKPENLLLNPLTNELKLCDFGCSVMADPESMDQNMASYVCSRYYRAPELILGSKCYGHAVDMWSFGCILGEMYLGHVWFDGDSSEHQMVEIIKVLGVPQEAEWKGMNAAMGYEAMKEQFEDDIQSIDGHEARNWSYALMACEVEESALDLIDRVLCYDPTDRLTAAEAVKHVWFQGMEQNEQLLNEFNVPMKAVSDTVEL